MRGKELKDFAGSADFKPTRRGVEIVFSDEDGIRLVFELNREEAEKFTTQMKGAARKLAPTPISESKRIGKTLRDWRLRQGMTMEDVSKHIGVSLRSVSMVETGFVSPAAQASIRYTEFAKRFEDEERAAGSD